MALNNAGNKMCVFSGFGNSYSCAYLSNPEKLSIKESLLELGGDSKYQFAFIEDDFPEINESNKSLIESKARSLLGLIISATTAIVSEDNSIQNKAFGSEITKLKDRDYRTYNIDPESNEAYFRWTMSSESGELLDVMVSFFTFDSQSYSILSVLSNENIMGKVQITECCIKKNKTPVCFNLESEIFEIIQINEVRPDYFLIPVIETSTTYSIRMAYNGFN